MNDHRDMVWAQCVNLYDVKKLCLSYAKGFYDEGLIDDVGIALFLRCDSIMEYTWANEGRVRCKRCYKQGTEEYIERRTGQPREILRCLKCGWQIRRRVYLSETDKNASGQFMAGHARRAFEDYYIEFPRCRDSGSKLLAINRLIHEFHWMLKRDDEHPIAMRTACVNLLEGTATQIMDLLNNLTYSENTDAEMLKTRNRWTTHIV